MNVWEKVRKDLEKEIKASIAFIKESTAALKKKTEELGEEGKRQYTIISLKTRIRNDTAELGGRVYDLLSAQKISLRDKKVQTVAARIKKLNTQITKLEEKGKVTVKKAPAKRPKKSKSI
jgi:hypothetical protein